jgi:Ca-activated chloride channel family protein
MPETRVVPVALPAGWKMFDNAARMRRSSSVRSYGAMPDVAAPVMAQRPMPAPARFFARSVGRPPGGFAAEGSGGFGADDEPQTARAPFIAPTSELEKTRKQDVDPVTAILASQLASGLWDDPHAGEVRATARALVELLKRGVTTAHPLHGPQVKKAVEVLIERALLVAAKEPRLAELAIAVAWLIASGPRTRASIAGLVDTTPALAPLRGRLDDTSLRADLDRLATA